MDFRSLVFCKTGMLTWDYFSSVAAMSSEERQNASGTIQTVCSDANISRCIGD